MTNSRKDLYTAREAASCEHIHGKTDAFASARVAVCRCSYSPLRSLSNG